MGLTGRTGPLADEPTGHRNFRIEAPAHRLFLEPFGPRLRAVVGDEVVADSTSVQLLHETGLPPVAYLPLTDVRAELLTPTSSSTHCPFKGDARYWTLTVGDEVRDDAVWNYPEPLAGAPPLADLVAFMPGAIDVWYEESEPLLRGPRDPYHRVDVVRSDRHVVIEVEGVRVAESARPTLLFETGLPPRTYLPEDDVAVELLEPSTAASVCPYKGATSRYWSIRAGERLIEDAIWVYDEPRPEAAGVARLLAFDDAKVELRWTIEPFAHP